jgi:hypothetical protein
MIDATVLKPFVDLNLEVEKRKIAQITMSNGDKFTTQISKYTINTVTGNVNCIYLHYPNPIAINADYIISIQEA